MTKNVLKMSINIYLNIREDIITQDVL